MITLPPTLTATRFHGYFWCVETNKLYSIKIGGVLHEMKLNKPNDFASRYGIRGAYYEISHKGKRRYLTLDRLQMLKLKDSEIPYEKK